MKLQSLLLAGALPCGPNPATRADDAGFCTTEGLGELRVRGVMMDEQGQPWPTLHCRLSGMEGTVQSWFQQQGRSWNLPVSIIDGEACIHVAAGATRGTWFIEGHRPVEISWQPLTPAEEGICGPVEPTPGASPEIRGRVVRGEGAPADAVIRVVGCDGGTLLQPDDSFRLHTTRQTCSLQASARHDTRIWRSPQVPVDLSEGTVLDVLLQLSESRRQNRSPSGGRPES